MLNAFLQQASSTGSKEIVGDLKNSSLSSKKTPRTAPAKNSMGAAIQNHFMKKLG